MHKRLILFIPYFLVIMALAVSFVPAQAIQPQHNYLQEGDDAFSLVEIRESEFHLFGPFATHSILFGLPANWQLLDGAQLTLDMNVSVSSLTAQSNATVSTASVGNLTVIMNDQTIAILPLTEDETASQIVPIPLAALTSLRADKRMELIFILSSGETCVLDQQLDVVIKSSTSFVFPHQVVSPDIDLTDFPRPIFQDSIIPDVAQIVIPDQPTAAELQSAITVAAGLQARTGNSMQLDMVTNRELTPEKLSSSHIILVGKPSTLPVMSQLTLPVQMRDGQFTESGDAGILVLVASPWQQDRVVLVVSGNSDATVIKAAQAMSTGVIRPNRTSNLALIDQVQNIAIETSVPVDQTFADMGHDDVILEGRGESSETFQFYVPAGFTASTEAFLDLSISHSSLLNYDQSGVFAVLNDQPIGSVRLSDKTANQANTHLRLAIPPSAVKGGVNTLDLSAFLQPVDPCGDPNQEGLFVSIWADESRLFLPLVPMPANLNSLLDLSVYPSPFIEPSSMSATAFVVEKNNPESWRYAMNIAEDLGATADGPVLMPALFYADDFPVESRSQYHVLLIGSPSKLPFLKEITRQLPAPFSDGSDLANERDLQVTYQITSETPVGYLELLASPWNSNNIIVAVVGNKPQGVTWSANALISTDLRDRLAGNFMIINGDQAISTDTRISLSEVLEPVPTPVLSDALETPAPSTSISTATYTGSRSIVVAMVVTGALIVIVLAVALYTGWRRSRIGRKQ